ncbi:peptidyl-prolyl cis-trans isomerase FKBP3-like [Anneissia japonica]|uniref:peptidyl-prolyl cis-trans isomerase FKBP3-like n=1 Tax=Anneissia japonica TaxID=1529436 RepID=UPI0014254FCE|nr:peptidyl-prolyl cis-trans isomerase FKBP3-like [Anneissia japonica]
MASAEVEPKWTTEEINSESVGKKDIIAFIQEHGARKFLAEKKMLGATKNIAKVFKKEALVAVYNELFETKAFKGDNEEEEEVVQVTKATEELKVTEKAAEKVPEAKKEPPRYKKRVLKKGDDRSRPQKGDTVHVWYTGKLDDGTVFDTNIFTGDGSNLFGLSDLMELWDEALLTMGIRERSEIVIEPEWAYGAKGIEGKIPPHSRLTFEMELEAIN